MGRKERPELRDFYIILGINRAFTGERNVSQEEIRPEYPGSGPRSELRTPWIYMRDTPLDRDVQVITKNSIT
jgi:hypothetical protein